MSSSPTPLNPFANVPAAAKDPILGVTEAFQADPNPDKVNLGVGVYVDEDGRVPLLECVRRAERRLAEQAAARGYLPIDGLAAYDRAVQELVFGKDSEAVQSGRVLTVQALGGTGALRIGADLLKRILPDSVVYISRPSWENHRALFEAAGFAVHEYRYYDPATRALDFSGMEADLAAIPRGAIVVLHACCHNPTGVDPTPEQWRAIARTVRERDGIPFLDLAYQGFAEGIEPDAQVVRLFAETPGPVLVASSFSKSFSLYGERIGALSIATASREEAARVLSQLKRVIRTNYSNPPTHGAALVATALTDAEGRALWEQELGAMRERIKRMRAALHDRLKQLRPADDFSHILKQRGMFSYSGLSKLQVERLRQEHAIYAIDSGRICIAALNGRNVERVARAIVAVL
ncbi:MAG: aspartate/tyrosine/aromatic aminotransferase [Casimicrobiaceae bacterium]|nr:aspartate/tyrosine/aromatic aminotransferase [Casimicrobiaceae bacterium]MCX8098049.1 aspartate/tyrosine/aromatic aminotransferase [Casimicrobiaceae bacterium]MDW8313304.1 amino acid aminotransferase [Burkholderiales bacterium]